MSRNLRVCERCKNYYRLELSSITSDYICEYPNIYKRNGDVVCSCMVHHISEYDLILPSKCLYKFEHEILKKDI